MQFLITYLCRFKKSEIFNNEWGMRLNSELSIAIFFIIPCPDTNHNAPRSWQHSRGMSLVQLHDAMVGG